MLTLNMVLIILPSSTGNIDKQFMIDFEDGTIPFLDYHRGNWQLDYNGTINGSTCVNLTYDGSEGVLADYLTFEDVLHPDSFEFKLKFGDEHPNDCSFKVVLQSPTVGSHIHSIYLEFNKNQSISNVYKDKFGGSTKYRVFNKLSPWQNSTIYRIKYFNIDYENMTFDCNISTASKGITQTIIGLKMYFPTAAIYESACLGFSKLAFSSNNADEWWTYPIHVFIDDITLGNRPTVTDVDAVPVGEPGGSAVWFRGNVGNMGSMFQPNSTYYSINGSNVGTENTSSYTIGQGFRLDKDVTSLEIQIWGRPVGAFTYAYGKIKEADSNFLPIGDILYADIETPGSMGSNWGWKSFDIPYNLMANQNYVFYITITGGSATKYLEWNYSANEDTGYMYNTSGGSDQYDATKDFKIRFNYFTNQTSHNNVTAYFGTTSIPDETKFYFNSYVTGWHSNPGNMVDGKIDSLAIAWVGIGDPYQDQIAFLNNHTGNITATPTHGINNVTISIRAYSNGAEDGVVQITPVFNGTAGYPYSCIVEQRPHVSSQYYFNYTVDFTDDPNAPASWSWADVKNMTCWVNATNNTGGDSYSVAVAKVFLTVTPDWENEYDAALTLGTNKTTGQSWDIYQGGLSRGTTYYYRTLIQNFYENATGGTWSDEGSFTTTPDDMTLSTSLRHHAFNVSFPEADGATGYLVRYDTSSFPTSFTDGTLLFNGTRADWIDKDNHSSWIPARNFMENQDRLKFTSWAYTTDFDGNPVWSDPEYILSTYYWNEPSIVSNASTNVEETTATINAYNYDGYSTHFNYSYQKGGFNWLHEYCDSDWGEAATSVAYSETNGYTSVGQMFTVGAVGENETFMLTNVSLRVMRQLNQFDEGLRVEIRNETASGKPGTQVFSKGWILSEDTPTALIWGGDGFQWVNITMSPYELKAGTNYSIVVISEDNGYNIGISDSDQYPGKVWVKQPPIFPNWDDILETGGADVQFKLHGFNASNATIASESPTSSNLALSDNLTGLDNGTLYTYWYWGQNNRNLSYWNTTTKRYFLTKPQAATTFTATKATNTSFNLSWVKGDGANYTHIRRQTGTYPIERDEGTLVYNDTGTFYVDTGLIPGTKYYYSAWSFTTWTTNPTLTQWSDAYTTASQRTNYSYNVSVLFEDTFTYVDLTAGGTYLLSIYFDIATYHYDLAAIGQNHTFNFSLDTTNRPKSLRLTVNNTYYRARVPTSNSQKIVFVIPRNDTDVWHYKFSLDDRSGLFAPPEVYIRFLSFENETQHIIHEEWFSQDQVAAGYLWHESPYNRYVAYIINDVTGDSYGAIVVYANETLEQSLVVYPTSVDDVYLFHEIIEFYGVQSGNYWNITFVDTRLRTYWANITVYELFGLTETYIGYYNSSNYEFTEAFSINSSRSHYALLNLYHQDLGHTQVRINYYHQPTRITSQNYIESWFTNMFGDNPLGWVNTISFIIAIIILMAFAPINAGVGVLASGVALGFLNIFMGFSVVSMTICIILVALGILWLINRSMKGGLQ